MKYMPGDIVPRRTILDLAREDRLVAECIAPWQRGLRTWEEALGSLVMTLYNRTQGDLQDKAQEANTARDW